MTLRRSAQTPRKGAAEQFDDEDEDNDKTRMNYASPSIDDCLPAKAFCPA